MLLRFAGILFLFLFTSFAMGSGTASSVLIQRSERPPNLETPLDVIDKDGTLTQNGHFFTRYHLGNIPKIAKNNWRLELKGEGLASPMSFSLADLQRNFKQTEVVALAYCSGNRRKMVEPRAPGVQWESGAMGNAVWKGVRLADILQRAGLKTAAVELVFDGADGPVLPQTPDFQKSLPLNKALDKDTIVALEMNGKPLPQNQGFPARLVVPGWTATYWVKHLISIEAVTKPFAGFWMKTAYRVPKGKFPGDDFLSQNHAENSPVTSIAVNSVITNVHDNLKIVKGKPFELRGLAWDGGSGIEKVEISTDGGQNWQKAMLDKDRGKYSWRRFRFTTQWRESGEKKVLARATNKAGVGQPNVMISNPAGYQYNVPLTIKVMVE